MMRVAAELHNAWRTARPKVRMAQVVLGGEADGRGAPPQQAAEWLVKARKEKADLIATVPLGRVRVGRLSLNRHAVLH